MGYQRTSAYWIPNRDGAIYSREYCVEIKDYRKTHIRKHVDLIIFH